MSLVRLSAIFASIFALLTVTVLADYGLAAQRYGGEYVRRVLLWRNATPLDWQRFPSRPIAVSTNPRHLTIVPEGPELVRTAFADLQLGETLDAFMSRTGTTSFLVLHRGRLLFERYYNGYSQTSVANSFSMAKSVTSLLVGAAMEDGLLPPVNTPAETLWSDFPGLHGSDLELRHVLQMTSGFAPFDDFQRFWVLGRPWAESRKLYFGTNLRRIISEVRPVVPPGSRFLYDDRNAMLLGVLLERVTGNTVSAYLERRLWQQIGAEFPASWSLDREGGFEKMETGINARPIDFLKLGELVLRNGIGPDGARLLPVGWVTASARPTDPEPSGLPQPDPEFQQFYGYMWWGRRRAEGPDDFEAEGLFDQHLYVSRARDAVILRTGDKAGPGWPGLLRRMVDGLP